MVSWQTFVRLAFEVADEQGMVFDGIGDGGELVSSLGDVWSDNKETVKQWTEQQAKDWIRDNIEP